MTDKGPNGNRECRKIDSLLVHGKISDFMSKPPITISQNATIADAKILMKEKQISGLPVVDEEQKLVGIISIENIIIALEHNQINDTIKDNMIADVAYLHEDNDISVFMHLLSDHTFGRYPVIDNNLKVVGIVTSGDLTAYLYGRLGNIYLHNKRLDGLMIPKKIPPRPKSSQRSEDSFSFRIEKGGIDDAGQGSLSFKRFLKEKGFPEADIRRATISVYEAEINIVLHGGGQGCIEGYLEDKQLYIVVMDKGPGIDDIEKAMVPGFSTATNEAREKGFGAGMGLDNIKKYSDKLVILSSGTGVRIEMVVITRTDPKND